MKSLGFPKMFNLSSTVVITDSHKATQRNLKSLLLSEKGELFGDPFFGLRLKKYLFNQNDSVLKDIIIDEIYTQIALFMPQLTCNRNDITIIQKDARLIASIKVTNKIDFKTDMFNIVLFQENEE